MFLNLLLSFFLSITMINCDKEATIADIKTELHNYLQNQADKGFHGTVLVVRDGAILLKAGYGMANIADNQINRPETIFPIGSITKQFTATAILLLESQGRLKTSDLITAFFDNVPSDKQDIQLHHLLNHTAGLEASMGSDFEEISKKDYLNRVWTSKLKADVGKKFHYSNTGYSLLAMVIEKVTHLSYEQFMIKHLFQPAGMLQTGYTLPWNKEKIAHLYGENGKDNGIYPDRISFPSWHLKGNGGILSTATDIHLWYEVLKNQAILPAAAWEKMLTPYKNDYGYGWDVLDKGDLIQHDGGSLEGVSAEFRWFKDKDVFIIILSNNIEWGFTIDKLRKKVAKIARK